MGSVYILDLKLLCIFSQISMLLRLSILCYCMRLLKNMFIQNFLWCLGHGFFATTYGDTICLYKRNGKLVKTYLEHSGRYVFYIFEYLISIN